MKTVLDRIRRALKEAARAIEEAEPGVERKAGGSPLTPADLAADKVLRDSLPTGDEGWLSEETVDDPIRLGKERVWIVDPLDGTKEFVAGIPEWAISVALVENGVPVAGGICNPATGETVLGAKGLENPDLTLTDRTELRDADILASRSEIKRGQWDAWKDGPIRYRPMGSIAWKLALLATGRADGVWSLAPKNEWDVAAGVALVLAVGGDVRLPDGSRRLFNQRDPLMPGLLATAPGLMQASLEATKSSFE